LFKRLTGLFTNGAQTDIIYVCIAKR